MCCIVLQCVAVCCSVLQCVAVRCSVLQCAAVCCILPQCAAVCCSVLQCAAVCYSVLQCVAVCCNVLQCVAMCCSVICGWWCRWKWVRCSRMLWCWFIVCNVARIWRFTMTTVALSCEMYKVDLLESLLAARTWMLWSWESARCSYMNVMILRGEVGGWGRVPFSRI